MKRVWLDTDPAMGVPLRDIDDGLAILLLLASPEVELAGISVNFGNVAAPRGMAAARELLEVTGRKVPLFEGAHTARDLGTKNAAVEAMIDAVMSRPKEVSLLAVAPLTNVATAMRLEPAFTRNLKELVVMGGTTHFLPFSLWGEFNFHLDAEAASEVMTAPIPKTLILMDLCRQAQFTREVLERTTQSDSAVARYVKQHVTPWLELHTKWFREPGFFPWDPIAAAVILAPELFEERRVSFLVQRGGLRVGRLLDLAPDPRSSVNVPERMNGRGFLDLIATRIGAL